MKVKLFLIGLILFSSIFALSCTPKNTSLPPEINAFIEKANEANQQQISQQNEEIHNQAIADMPKAENLFVQIFGTKPDSVFVNNDMVYINYKGMILLFKKGYIENDHFFIYKLPNGKIVSESLDTEIFSLADFPYAIKEAGK